MRRFSKGAALFLALVTPYVQAQNSLRSWDAFHRSVIETLDFPRHRGLEAAVSVRALFSGRMVYAFHDAQPLHPASVNKLFTSYAALKVLHPSFQFHTQIFAEGALKGGVLKGNLFVKGFGDPNLVSEQLWRLVNDLRRTGLKRVEGNLIVDSSFFGQSGTPETRPSYLRDQAYNSPIGALSFNFNTTSIFVLPGDTVGALPRVYVDPENPYVDVVNQAKTTAEGVNHLHVSRLKYVPGDAGDTVLLRGTIPVSSPETVYYRNIVNPALYTGHMLTTFLSDRHITILGNVVEGTVPEHAQLLLDFKSRPLTQLVEDMNKFSNNFMADQLFFRVGAEIYSPPASLSKGQQAMIKVLTEAGLAASEFHIEDGSGLTRHTAVSARAITELLWRAHHDVTLGPEFEASLSLAQEDGTARKRFIGAEVAGKLRVKTGTMDGISALAGLCTNQAKETYLFSIVLNDRRQQWGNMRKWADKIVMALEGSLLTPPTETHVPKSHSGVEDLK